MAAILLYGGGGDDILNGGNGNDRLISDAGNDSLNGGAGDDIYEIDSANDIVHEAVGEGTDIVRSTATYTLTSNVERLELMGSANINGTGSNVRDILVGNAGVNVLNGLDGDDTLYGGAGNDTLNGGNGNDTLDGQGGVDAMVGGLGNDLYFVDNGTDVVTEVAGQGTDTVRSTVSYVLAANVERLELQGISNINGAGTSLADTIVGNTGNNILTGNDGNDSLYGGAGNDTLNGNNGNDFLTGGTGNDTMAGGTGDDLYEVDSTSDVVTESSGAGYDSIRSWVTYTMSANTERMDLQTTGNIDGTGNADRNTMMGNAGNNVLSGLDGNDDLFGNDGADTLIGGNGNDLLVGGAGNDTMQGGANNDIYRYVGSGVFGADIINDGGGVGSVDTLDLLGFTLASVSSWSAVDSADGDNFFDQLLMNFANGSSITVNDFFNNSGLEVAGAGALENILFSNATLHFAEVSALV
jgi:Ca2+-binding RTX toxin-like protein